MIDWSKPIETVPDERNPTPVVCEYNGVVSMGDYEVFIRGDWFYDENCNQRDFNDYDPWHYDENGDPNYDRLPLIRNTEPNQ